MGRPKRAANAYQCWQASARAGVRAELMQARGGAVSSQDVMRELARRWKQVSPEEKAPFEQEAAADRARYAAEVQASALAAEAEAQAKAAAAKAPVTGPRSRKRSLAAAEAASIEEELNDLLAPTSGPGSRGPRASAEAGAGAGAAAGAEPEADPEANPEPDSDSDAVPEEPRPKPKPRKKAAAAKPKAKKPKRAKGAKAAARRVQGEQMAALQSDIDGSAEARLKFLLRQSSLFQHFGGSLGEAAAAQEQAAAGPAGAGPKRGGGGAGAAAREDELLGDEAAEVTRLTQQPSCVTGTMRHYQLEGLNWLIGLSAQGINGILADEMGLGKTLQTISLLGYHLEYKGVRGPHLIIVPNSTLGNWISELRKWCPSLRTLRFHGSKAERAEMVETVLVPRPAEEMEWDVLVTSFEIALREKQALRRIAWRYLIIDEAHRLKNEQSSFAQTVRLFASKDRLLLTGTPLQNNLHELWALLNFLLPDVFASAEQFDEWFNFDTDDDAVKERLIQQLHKVLRPFMLRRLKADVEKALPPKTETLLFVGMTAMQRELYKKTLLRDRDVVSGSGREGRGALLNLVMQLRKVCAHPYLFEGVEDRSLDPMGNHVVANCGKLVLLDKLLPRLQQRGSRVLIFSQMTRVLDILEDYCRMRALGYCRIDGNSSYDDRTNQIEDYNSPGSDKFVFLLSTRAGGLGINLYTADVVVLYDSDWNPQADLQAQDRAHRIGQTKPVSVYRLVTADTIEEKIIERAQQKLKLDAMVIQSGRLQDKNKAMSKDEMLEMIRFGADQVFRSGEGEELTDHDIDTILAQGQERTAALNSKLEEHVKGNLLDFKLDGSNSMEFEGVNYREERERQAQEEQQRQLIRHLNEEMTAAVGKRKAKPAHDYNEEHYYRMLEGDGADPDRPRRPPRPKALRLPKMEEWQFYNRDRVLELHNMEKATHQNWVDIGAPGQCPPLLPSAALQAERDALRAHPGADWSRSQFLAFCRALARHGRDDLAAVAAAVDGRSEDEVRAYAAAFWTKGPKAISGWARIQKNITKGETKLQEIRSLTAATRAKVARCERPLEQMGFAYGGKQGKAYTEEEDRYLLVYALQFGYGNWEAVRNAVRAHDRFRFDYFLRSRSAVEIGRRCDTLMHVAEREEGGGGGGGGGGGSGGDGPAAAAAVKPGATVPDDQVGRLVERVAAAGALGMEKLVRELMVLFPGIPKRALERKVQEVAVKEKRPGDKRASWHLRAAFSGTAGGSSGSSGSSGEAGEAGTLGEAGEADPEPAAKRARTEEPAPAEEPAPTTAEEPTPMEH